MSGFNAIHQSRSGCQTSDLSRSLLLSAGVPELLLCLRSVFNLVISVIVDSDTSDNTSVLLSKQTRGTPPPTPTPGGRPRPLTVAVDSEGRPGGGDLVVADLAVLGRAVLVGGLHLQDVVVNLALGDGRPILALPKHRGKLVHVVDLDVDRRPADRRNMSSPALSHISTLAC